MSPCSADKLACLRICVRQCLYSYVEIGQLYIRSSGTINLSLSFKISHIRQNFPHVTPLQLQQSVGLILRLATDYCTTRHLLSIFIVSACPRSTYRQTLHDFSCLILYLRIYYLRGIFWRINKRTCTGLSHKCDVTSLFLLKSFDRPSHKNVNFSWTDECRCPHLRWDVSFQGFFSIAVPSPRSLSSHWPFNSALANRYGNKDTCCHEVCISLWENICRNTPPSFPLARWKINFLKL